MVHLCGLASQALPSGWEVILQVEVQAVDGEESSN